MIDIEKLIPELRSLEIEKRSKLLRALLDLLPEPDSNEVLEDFVPIDIPIEYDKNKETGDLKIRFAYQVGFRNPKLAWRVMNVTQGAQLALLNIFSESMNLDQKAGRNPSKQTTIQ